jgi:hypothetical protein
VSGEDASGRGPGGGRDADGDDAAWRDLIARFDLPATDQPDAAPWPDRESLTPPARDEGTATQLPGAERARVIRPAAPSPAGPPGPLPPAEAADLAGAAPGDHAADAGTAASQKNDLHHPDGTAEEHFVPPPPPPLPHLDPVAKGAWTALFGGPAYLLWATLMGWVVPGWAALLAVAAFVGGFAVVVLRLGDRPSDGAGPDDDDGAVL